MGVITAAMGSSAYYATKTGRTKSKKYHAIVKRRDGSIGPACGLSFYDESTEELPFGLLESEKCGAPGCRKAFNEATQGADHDH